MLVRLWCQLSQRVSLHDSSPWNFLKERRRGPLFVVAVTPAVLEEVIFRGMLQGRLMALMGRFGGFFVTAVAFAVVHGQPVALPIHLSLGLYLGWLRERANSLLPCMLMHFLYNGTLVTLEHLQLG